MKRDIRAYLHDVKQLIEFLQSAVADRRKEDLDADQMFRLAIERAFITIGEAISQVHKQRPDVAESIQDWRRIIDFRNVLVHGYFALEANIIWDTLQQDLPVLAPKVDHLLESIDLESE